MSDDQTAKVTAHQKNDDDKWYYSISGDDERVGPYDSEEEALAAGEEVLDEMASDDDDEDEDGDEIVAEADEDDTDEEDEDEDDEEKASA
jgi:hypothetical protein